MIIRRFTTAIRKQDWGLVALDFLVVVAGIFVGLQVDDWNRSREDRRLEEEYLLRIQSDLQSDFIDLSEAVEVSIEQVRSINWLLGQFDDPLAEEMPFFPGPATDEAMAKPIEELVPVPHSGHYIWLIVRSREFYPSKSTYNELLATGRVAVIGDSRLRRELIQYYEDVEEVSFDGPLERDKNLVIEAIKASGYNPNDFRFLKEPLSKLDSISELPVHLRAMRRAILRKIGVLTTIETSLTSILSSLNEQIPPLQ